MSGCRCRVVRRLDEAFVVDGEVRGGVVDVVFVKVVDVLFADKNGETGFENFIEFRGG